ncbi:DUF2973 domain-containing protein [Prochlorococcus marinus]|uniref:DUF2973 domain-containing protein n=1 Tax=Prochlorococcus marinus XMU1408 TaxID=2213228 RepID=A0A318R5X0_PROMR|nr:DUF2973 domain-containing protein [Prochlorococcus marinus]MBW3041151.1 DUF2973 domain-containing protein [Prochlorococcus marinus str. XMU1408]PYE03749.1 DUF2973 domain-containing protein [Prochlorococcus marinus XMU1408]
MLSNFLPFLYGLSVFVLLILAARIMLNGFFTGQPSKTKNAFSNERSDDRTGLVTIHPEILNKDGDITDEDLLTVRFSKDTDHPQSYEKPSE